MTSKKCRYANIIAYAQRNCLADAKLERLWFLQQVTSLEEAVRAASRSKFKSRISGRIVMNGHQCRVGRAVLDVAEEILIGRLDQLKNANDFDELYEIVRVVESRPRLGPLTTYDLAERIGWFAEIYPAQVYVHAGAKEGARAIGAKVKDRRIPLAFFRGSSFGSLSAAEIETVLCVHKNDLANPADFDPKRPVRHIVKRRSC